MKLQIFDFDETLFRTQAPMSAEHRWYDKPDSLNPDKYHIPCIETVADIARASDNDPKIKRILITKRIPALTAEVLYLLREHGIALDKHYIIGHDANKPDVLADILAKDYADIDFQQIDIYEDCMFQVLEYQHFFQHKIHYPNPINVKYFFVDKTHLIELQASLRANVISKIKIGKP